VGEAVKRDEPIRCAECARAGLRPRTVAVVVISDTGYDVWRKTRHRRPMMDADEDEGSPIYRVAVPGEILSWRAGPGEQLPCGRRHHGVDGYVTLDAETVASALRRAGAPADLPRERIDPAKRVVDISDT
jgi:hypothetical protein